MTSFYDGFLKLFANPSITVTVTNYLAVIIGISLSFLAVKLSPKEDRSVRAINFLVVVFGILVGWALAIFWVLFDETEKSVFNQVGATVSAFVAGYGISKFDKLFEAALYENGKPNPAVINRVGLLFSALLLAAVVVVTNRVAWLSDDRAKFRNSPDALILAASEAAVQAACAQLKAEAAKVQLTSKQNDR